MKAQHRAGENLRLELKEAFQRVLTNSGFINGQEVRIFERQFAKYCGKKQGIGTSNGTSSLTILKSLGVVAGDEVIVPVNTFIATAEAVSLIGAKPRFVDVNEDGLVDPDLVDSSINSRTKAVIPVHLYGNVCDMPGLFEVAKFHGLEIILEDCAQAHGAKLNEVRVPIGSVGSFSFYPGKSLGALGDAGAVVCDDENLATRFRSYVNHGRDPLNKDPAAKYTHEEEGFNFRMDELQAAFLSVKLQRLDDWLKRKREIAATYDCELKGVIPMKAREGVTHGYHLYVISSDRRDELADYLKKQEIETGIHYPIPLHLQPAFSDLGYREGDFPVAERLAKEILSIPIYPEMTDDQVYRVIEQINQFNKN